MASLPPGKNRYSDRRAGSKSARRRGVSIMAYRAAQSEDNKSDHQNKKWTFFPIVPFCLGGLRREPDVSGRRVRPVVLISPGYGRGGRRSAPDMAIITMYVVTKVMREGYWTKNAVCLTAGGINRGRANTSHSGTCNILWRVNPESGTGQRHWRPVRGDLPGAPGILFKITVAVAVVQEVGQRHRAIAGVSVNCCFTVTYVVFGAKNISENF
ncbi:hypothetical protein AI2826V1_5051 (plasmid) [Citrobacter freundii]|nr:hypothetical protein AI2826V1_5051 [Citrobacter freundii]CAH5297248.1 hypothetical protein AI2826V1_5051 [Citrobacter freundii]